MLGEVFYWLFNMSVTAAVTGLVILAVRRLPHIPKRISAFLWIIPFIRLYIPIGIGSRYSLMSIISELSERPAAIKTDIFPYTAMNHVILAESYSPFVYKSEFIEKIFAIASTLWLSVAALIILFAAVAYIRTLHEFKNAVLLYGNIYKSEKADSPFLLGILKPKIIIPESFSGADLTYIIMHENMHRKRLDNLWRIIGIFTAALHWFNPFVWLFLKCFLSDTELACDEAVLTTLGESEKKQYALSLVGAVKSRGIFASAFGGAKMRKRIESILSYRRVSVFSAVCFAVFLCAIGYVLLTNTL